MNRVKDKHRRIKFAHNWDKVYADRTTFKNYIDGKIGIDEACRLIAENNKCTVTPTQFKFEAHNCGYFTKEERMKLFEAKVLI